ncbi:MAG: PilN domain-containing protein [Hormoscilla sp.]
MYSLEINFLADRPEYQQPKKEKGTGTGSQINPKDIVPVAAGLMVAGALVGGALGIKMYYDGENEKLQAKVGKADSSLNQIEAKKKKIEAINKETEEIDAQTEALATVFNQIKPWSALLQEIRDRTPSGVQIEAMKQVEVVTRIPAKNKREKPTEIKKVGIEITGLARSYNDVNDFMLMLKKSSFFSGEETEMLSTRMTTNPTRVKVPEGSEIKVELPPVVRYKIRTFLSDVPAEELLAELERKGALGLVNRIEDIKRIRE